MTTEPEITLFDHPVSANSYRVRLVLAALGLPHRLEFVDLAKGAQRDAQFLAINPLGQVPALVDGQAMLWDSHAIAIYLVERYGAARREELWPADPLERAQVSRWLYFDANELHNGVGIARNVTTFGGTSSMADASPRATAALDALEYRLTGRDWLELGRPTLADLCCYPLVSVRAEAGLHEPDRPSLLAWEARIAGLGLPPPPSLARLRAGSQ